MLAIFCFVVAGVKIGEIPVKRAEARAIIKCTEIYQESLSWSDARLSESIRHHSLRANRGWEESKFFLRCIGNN